MMDSPHVMMMGADTADASREAYWGELQTFLEAELRPGFRSYYETAIAPRLATDLGREPDRRQIAAAMADFAPNHAWQVMRTEAQRQAFAASRTIVDGQVETLVMRAAALGNGPAVLELDPDVPFSDHVHNGAHNMSGGDTDRGRHHPLAAGATYDRALSVHRIAAMGPLVDDVGHSIAARLVQAFPDFAPRQILELGCTVGHTLLPFKDAFPAAQVIGIDVSAPCLAFGAARASGLGAAVTFSRRSAEHTGYADGSFDLVFSRILLHETCEQATRAILAECHRLLRPGGIIFHCDAPQFDELDSYEQSLRDRDINSHAEPFMNGYHSTDLEQEFSRAGFAHQAMFRMSAPSLMVKRGYGATKTGTRGDSYFFSGAIK
jgi:SAM-dependent methyltransferase